MTCQPENIIASGHPAVSQTAMEILRAGGNAFDAAVAAGFVSSLAEPALTSLGGGGFLLGRTADNEEILFDFFTDTPGRGLPDPSLSPHFYPVKVSFSGSDQVFNIGLGSAAVPGTLKGYLHVHRRLGRMPLAEVLMPAITHARHGLPINRHQSYFSTLLKSILSSTNRAAKLFAPNGNFLSEGDIYRNIELADFLSTLPHDGAADFYKGEIAKQIAAEMKEGQGLLTEADLNAYAVIERVPLRIPYRGRWLLTNPPPSLGGRLIAQSLRLLDSTPLNSLKWGAYGHLLALARTMQEVDQHRTELTASQDDECNHPPSGSNRSFTRGTTHLSIIDRHGNVASMTTSNGEGSGYIVPGTGIMLNNMLGEDDLHPDGFHSSQPGQRVASMMSPSILFDDSGNVQLALGSGGSKRLRTAILQVLTNVIDFSMSTTQAVERSRVHWDGEFLQIEPGFSDETVAALAAQLPLNLWPAKDMYFGGVHAVSPHDGAGDPRRGGAWSRD